MFLPGDTKICADNEFKLMEQYRVRAEEAALRADNPDYTPYVRYSNAKDSLEYSELAKAHEVEYHYWSKLAREQEAYRETSEAR